MAYDNDSRHPETDAGARSTSTEVLTTLFVTILVLRGRVNFRNLIRYCDYWERTSDRQFREPFDWTDLHQRVLMTALDPRAELISAHDASFIPKSGKQTFGLGHCFNGCARRAERGLEISTLAAVDVTRRCASRSPFRRRRRARTPPRLRRKKPGATSRGSHCVRIGIACRRASPIIA